MAARDMPWVPANMTTERRKRVESYANLHRISRAEAAGRLIDLALAVVDRAHGGKA
jgi:hypothetical protein